MRSVMTASVCRVSGPKRASSAGVPGFDAGVLGLRLSG